MPHFAIIGINDVARTAARGAIIAGLIIGAHEPGEGIVQAGFVDIDHWHRDAQAGAGATVGLADIGAARLFQTLDGAQ